MLPGTKSLSRLTFPWSAHAVVVSSPSHSSVPGTDLIKRLRNSRSFMVSTSRGRHRAVVQETILDERSRSGERDDRPAEVEKGKDEYHKQKQLMRCSSSLTINTD